MTLLLLAACDGTLTYIAVEGSTSTTVEAGTVLEELLDDFGFDGLSDMDVTADQELANQGVKPGDISTAVLTELVFEAESGSPDLNFLTSVSVGVEAEGLDALEIASQDTFPAEEPVVSLDVTGADIEPYVVSQEMTLSVDASGRRPDEDTVVRVDYTLVVGVTTQGAVSNIDP